MTQNWWIGSAGAMQLFPSPNNPVVADPSRRDQVTYTGDGTATRIALKDSKRAWQLPFLGLLQSDQDLVQSFYEGLWGDGPFRLVDPTYSNVLTLDQSTMGLRPIVTDSGWAKSAGSLAIAASGGPGGLASGVLTWSSLSASATLLPGSATNTLNPATAPVYVPGEPVTVSVYAKASAAVTATLQLVGASSTGAITVSSAAVSVLLSTSWQRFAVSIAANAAAYASCLYVAPRLVLPATGLPSSVSLAAAQVEYASCTSMWQRGYGAPTVNFVQSTGHSVPLLGTADKTVFLAEAA